MISEIEYSTSDLYVRTVENKSPFQRRTLQIPIETNGIKAHALIDSGATGYFIDQNFTKENQLKMEKLYRPIQIRNVDGTENIAGRITDKVTLKFTMFGRTMSGIFLVTVLGKQAIILGLPWLERANPDINWKGKTLRWRSIQEEEEEEFEELETPT